MKKITYWVLQLTWGGLMTFVGLAVTAFLFIFMRKKIHFHKNGFSYIIEVGGNWGGVSLGAVALCGTYAQKDSKSYSLKWFDETRKHEFGHSLQNIILGPFMLFIVAIPSALRYWYERIVESKGKKLPDGWYYKIWFERTASDWGTKAVERIEKEKAN